MAGDKRLKKGYSKMYITVKRVLYVKYFMLLGFTSQDSTFAFFGNISHYIDEFSG